MCDSVYFTDAYQTIIILSKQVSKQKCKIYNRNTMMTKNLNIPGLINTMQSSYS